MANTANPHALSGAAVTLYLGGKEYLLSPLTDRDDLELTDYVRQRYIRNARDWSRSMSRQDRDEIMSVALRTASNLSWRSDDGRAILSTPDGLARLAWQGVRGNHGNVTPESILELITANPEDAHNVADAFRRANAPQTNSKDSEGSDPTMPPIRTEPAPTPD
jgi:hypothetical protein